MAAPANKWSAPGVLEQRVWTALALAPLVVASVRWLPTAALAWVFGLLALAAGWEWAALSGWRSRSARFVYLAALSGALFSIEIFLPQDVGATVLMAGLAGWALACGWLAYPAFRANGVVKALAGLWALACAWLAILGLHGLGERGPWWLLYLLTLVWLADSGAYFVGRRFGRRKLAPRISPGKTWAGAYGALLAAALYAWGVAAWLALPSVGAFVALSMCAAACSVAGDLFESLLKRQAGTKDSGALLPGHGGLLDRVDGLLVAAPVFGVGLPVVL